VLTCANAPGGRARVRYIARVERVLFAPRELPPLRPDVAEDPRPYDAWLRRRAGERTRRRRRASGPELDLVLALDTEPGDATARTLRSLRAQSSSRWNLALVVQPRWADASRAAAAAAGRRVARRTRVVAASDGSPLRALLQLGLAAGEGPAVALIFDGDAWAPDAVRLLGGALRDHDVVYADEDRIDADGRHVEPRLKPAYSPDFLLSSAYVGRPVAARRSVLTGLDLTAGEEGALEHEWALHACGAAATVQHLSDVLCHRTGNALTPIDEHAHVEAALRRRDDASRVERGRTPGTFRIVRSAPAGTTASVIVPFRDQPRFLRTCADSVRATAHGTGHELILVDNGSVEPETRSLVEELAQREGVRVLSDPRPFNWARLNNEAAAGATGDVLVFLNNDIEVRQSGWLEALCAQATRPDVAAAGARLLYPGRRLQHCGIVVGLTGAAGHPLLGLSEDAPGYLQMATAVRECAAVTGACFATRRDVFAELAGFDEDLGVDLNDVDYCLRAAQRGYRVIYEPAAELTHHESPSRGTAGGTGDIVNFVKRWAEYIDDRDPYLNPHLTRDDPSCGLATPEEKEAWDRWRSTLMAG
jgi:GT2 family glycosyltransferase